MKYQQFGKMQKPIPPGKLVFAFIFLFFSSLKKVQLRACLCSHRIYLKLILKAGVRGDGKLDF